MINEQSDVTVNLSLVILDYLCIAHRSMKKRTPSLQFQVHDLYTLAYRLRGNDYEFTNVQFEQAVERLEADYIFYNRDTFEIGLTDRSIRSLEGSL